MILAMILALSCGYLNLESKFDTRPMWTLLMVEGSNNHKHIIIID
jgi:hypothetical protein